MTFKQNLGGFKINFDNKLKIFLDEQIHLASKLSPAAELNMRELASCILAGGKRFRPALVYYVTLLAEKNPDESVFELGIALELLHSFALVHDDIIDKSLFRRNVPTIEAAYQKHFVGMKDGKYQAMSAAILSGDYAHTLADMTMNNLRTDNKTRKKISKLYYEMQIELIGGQVDDCFGVGLSDLDQLSEEHVLNMLEKKSGNYSIQKPIMLGAILAGMSNSQIRVLEDFGYKLGLVFQIRDDILGLFGEEKAIGKSTTDITEGKKTLIMLRTYQLMDTAEKIKLKSILGNLYASTDETDWLKSKIVSLGIIRDMETYSENLIAEAKQLLLNNFEKDNEGMQFLFDLSDFLLVRSS